MARGVNGMCPDGACWPWPMISSTWLADGLQRDAERLERLGGDAFALVDQAEQDVLGADVVVVEHPGLFLGQDDNPPGAVGEPLEHVSRSSRERSGRWSDRLGTDHLSLGMLARTLTDLAACSLDVTLPLVGSTRVQLNGCGRCSTTDPFPVRRAANARSAVRHPSGCMIGRCPTVQRCPPDGARPCPADRRRRRSGRPAAPLGLARRRAVRRLRAGVLRHPARLPVGRRRGLDPPTTAPPSPCGTRPAASTCRAPGSSRWAGSAGAATRRASGSAWATYRRRDVGARRQPAPHWYLGVLATEPARQGTGLGRAVTAPMLAAADRAGLPAYLETASERT